MTQRTSDQLADGAVAKCEDGSVYRLKGGVWVAAIGATVEFCGCHTMTYRDGAEIKTPCDKHAQRPSEQYSRCEQHGVMLPPGTVCPGCERERRTSNPLHTCPDCRCQFVQPFKCMTCGALKLYDATVLSQAETIERQRAWIEWVREFYPDIADDADERAAARATVVATAMPPTLSNEPT